jgi:RNA polymerase sigma factor (sigma-70 family)
MSCAEEPPDDVLKIRRVPPASREALLASSSEEERERALAALVVHCVEPVVRRVVRSRLRSGPTWVGQDADDVASRAMMHVVARLRGTMDGAEPILDLESYAGSVARRACDDHLRAKYPRRWRLKNQLRYVLSHDPRFAIWETAEGWTCGLASWRGTRPGPAPLSEAPPAAAASVADLLAGLFARSGGPLDLDAVVSLATETWGLRDQPPADAGRLADSRAVDPLTALVERSELARLWQEILALPLRQRTALLLNLRDGGQGDVIAVLPSTGVASLRQIAAALEVPESSLAEIWARLPLDDREIAARLGLTRQQVINLRKSARARLRRRTGHSRTPHGQ